MDYTKFHDLKPACLPSVDTVNAIRQKYYPQMPALEPVKDAKDSQCEPGKPAVTQDQLDGFVYDAAYGDPNDPNDGWQPVVDKAVTKKDPGAIFNWALGTGEVGKYERMVDEVAESTKNPKSGWLADRVSVFKTIFDQVKQKVVAMWTKVANWIKSLFE
jgi:hypothetical protein